MATTETRVAELRDTLTSLAGHDNALIRSAVRLSLNELDMADLTGDPGPHLEQVTRLLDAALNPDPITNERTFS